MAPCLSCRAPGAWRQDSHGNGTDGCGNPSVTDCKDPDLLEILDTATVFPIALGGNTDDIKRILFGPIQQLETTSFRTHGDDSTTWILLPLKRRHCSALLRIFPSLTLTVIAVR